MCFAIVGMYMVVEVGRRQLFFLVHRLSEQAVSPLDLMERSTHLPESKTPTLDSTDGLNFELSFLGEVN